VLTLAALWIALSVVAIGVGSALLRVVDASPPGRVADKLFFAWWTGIVALAWTSFALANVVPLRDAMPWLIVASCVVAVSSFWCARERWRVLRPAVWILFVALAVFLAERSVAIGNLEDTGGYHWSIIQWYGSYGVPVGLGLFQWRLATHSAWLALTAALDIGILESRVATFANGLVFLGCLWFAVVCALRWIRGCATLADRFIVAAFAFLLQLTAKWEMRLSPSPDIPVIFLTVFVCWTMLSDGSEERPSERNLLILAMLSVVAITIKLNALPLALVCTALFWMRRDVALRTRVVGTAWLGVIATPLIVASWTSTGCLLFPAPLVCVDGPSAIGATAARQYAAIIGATARNDITFSIAVSLVALAYLWWARRELPDRAVLGPIAIALAGVAFTAFVAPTTRFAIGYLTILPALVVAHVTPTLAAFAAALPQRGVIHALGRPYGAHAAGRTRFASGASPRMLSTLRAGVSIVLAIAIAVPLYKEFIYSSVRTRHFDSWAERKRGDTAINAPNPDWWLLPNRISYGGAYETAHATGFDYAVSPQMTCWNHPQPCASNPPLSALPDLRLRDPGRGLAGGFVRTR
jgi:hypothetical protein